MNTAPMRAPHPCGRSPHDPGTNHPGPHDPGTNHPGPPRPGTPALEILAPGPSATVQDAGRTGYGHLGVGRSGAADTASSAAANRLVGNAPGAAGIESTMGGLTVLAHTAVTVAVTGAVTGLVIDGVPEPDHWRIRLRAGSRLTVSPPLSGLRNYLAIRGGIVAVHRAGDRIGPELGSLATDALSGLGPSPLAAGDGVEIGAPAGPLPTAEFIAHAAPRAGGTTRLPIVRGPRGTWFTPESRARLTRGHWTVGAQSDRIGVRLSGAEPLVRSRTGEIASEPMVTGALQVPPDGRPVLFLADHPVTGGYPVIAVLRDAAIPLAAQLRPGDRVMFTD